MITLAHLRALLERALTHAENPAIGRLPVGERTWGHVARAYLAHVIYGANPITGARLLFWPSEVMTADEQRVPLDLTDPGTAHALLVALALALGLDPGAGSLEVRLHRHVNSGAGESAQRAWVLSATGGAVVFASDAAGNRTPKHHRIAPDVAAEPDPIKALGLAVLHVLGVKP